MAALQIGSPAAFVGFGVANGPAVHVTDVDESLTVPDDGSAACAGSTAGSEEDGGTEARCQGKTPTKLYGATHRGPPSRDRNAWLPRLNDAGGERSRAADTHADSIEA